MEQDFNFLRVLQVRTAGPPEAMRTRVQQEIAALDPDLPLADFQTMTESLSGFMGFRLFQMGAQQAGAMGLLGLLLAAIGVYGVVSYGAAQRTREIGIRMALGAQPANVLAMILRQGVWLVAGGVAGGMVLAAMFARLASRVLPLVASSRVTTVKASGSVLAFTVVTLLLAAIALWACYIPARRAMRIDPVVALRHE
jgi:putative ABC transport system permease protein